MVSTTKTSPLLENLLDILPDNYSRVDREFIIQAYNFAENAHAEQKRASGEPYITHCVAVSIILAEMHVQPVVVAAGLLHDTVEDTSVTLQDIQRNFGDEVAKLVDGVTKLTHLPRVSRADQPQNDTGINVPSCTVKPFPVIWTPFREPYFLFFC